MDPAQEKQRHNLVMAVIGIEIVREGGDCYRATVPRRYSTTRVLFTRCGCEGKGAVARVGGAGNAGCGASPTAGKREGISF